MDGKYLGAVGVSIKPWRLLTKSIKKQNNRKSMLPDNAVFGDLQPIELDLYDLENVEQCVT